MKQKKLGIVLLCAAMVLGVMFTSCDMGGDEGTVTITSCDPATGIVNEALAVAISGDYLADEYSPGKQVSLISGASTIAGTNVTTVTGVQINVDFDFSNCTPATYNVYIVDENGNEDTLTEGFTLTEYEVIQEALSSAAQIDLDAANIAYDFSVNGTCAEDSAVRDVTFTLDGANDPAITITAGGSGGIIYYSGGFDSLEQASDIESDYANYARDGDGGLPMSLHAGEYYSLIDVADPDRFIILEIISVDTTNDIVDFNYLIIRKIAFGNL
jgi:hypothetical protein